MTARTTRLLLPLALLAALGACSAGSPSEDDGAEQEQALTAAQQAAESAATPPAGPVDAAPPPPMECDATQLQGLVGQVLEENATEQARTDAGAKSVRVLKPGDMVTMEFDSERLSIEVDAAGKITSLRCG